MLFGGNNYDAYYEYFTNIGSKKTVKQLMTEFLKEGNTDNIKIVSYIRRKTLWKGGINDKIPEELLNKKVNDWNFNYNTNGKCIIQLQKE